MKSIDEQLAEIRAELARISGRELGNLGLRQASAVMIGKRRMVPASEVRRLASTDERTIEAKPTRSGLQDPEALRRRR